MLQLSDAKHQQLPYAGPTYESGTGLGQKG
jgi:hypothetical protein